MCKHSVPLKEDVQLIISMSHPLYPAAIQLPALFNTTIATVIKKCGRQLNIDNDRIFMYFPGNKTLISRNATVLDILMFSTLGNDNRIALQATIISPTRRSHKGHKKFPNVDAMTTELAYACHYMDISEHEALLKRVNADSTELFKVKYMEQVINHYYLNK